MFSSSVYLWFSSVISRHAPAPDHICVEVLLKLTTCRDQLLNDYPEQAAEARGERRTSGDVPRARSPSTSTDVTGPEGTARARLGDDLIDSNPIPPALEGALSLPRLVDESMSGGHPSTPEPNTISMDAPATIGSPQSDRIPPHKETEMKTFGMSTSVRMEEQVFPHTAEFDEQDVACDIADLSDTGNAPPSGVRRIMLLGCGNHCMFH